MTSDGSRNVGSLLRSVVALPPEERAAFVRELCASDPVLGREIRSLLHDDAGDGALPRSHPSDPRSEPSASAGTPAPHELPERIGHYAILDEIGRGGMGVVYLAEDLSLGRRLAIKVLPPDLATDPARLRRFRREARLIASLNHPNVATIYSFEERDHSWYLTMELVEGASLDTRLSSGPLPIGDSLDVMRQIASALEAAHAKGDIHRDLKPGNVMLTPHGVVKVLDFGLAKRADSLGVATKEKLTLAGAILGTPGYASPEQLQSDPVDERTDIWSFGCVFYECLTGLCPFAGSGVMRVVTATLDAAPDWTELPAELSPRLRDLITDCLAKDPEDRPPDMGYVSRILAGEAVPAGDRRPRPRPVDVPNNVPRVGVELRRTRAAARRGQTASRGGPYRHARRTRRLRQDTTLDRGSAAHARGLPRWSLARGARAASRLGRGRQRGGGGDGGGRRAGGARSRNRSPGRWPTGRSCSSSTTAST